MDQMDAFLEAENRRRAPIRRIFGPEKRRAIPILEDCPCYPADRLAALVKMLREIESCTEEETARRKTEEFAALREGTHRLPDAPEPIVLWPEGKIPTLTEYRENADYRYNHAPDFVPHMFEMLLPENRTPKGAVVLCAGGDHGEAVLAEGYQVGLDFNHMGYQCFLLLNRTNRNPWSEREAGVDAARAVRYVRKHAQRYRVGENQIAFAGFSNGGLTGEACIQYYSGAKRVRDVFPDYVPDELDECGAAPDAFLCIYGPRFKGVPFDFDGVVYPPTFFAVGREDSAMDNLNYVYPQLVEHGVEVEVHTFAGVPHGQAGVKILDGEIKYPNFELWEPLADSFLQNVFQR